MLYKRLKATMNYVFDKKNKRFKDYIKTLSLIHLIVRMVGIPNSTRVAEASRLIECELGYIFAVLS